MSAIFTNRAFLCLIILSAGAAAVHAQVLQSVNASWLPVTDAEKQMKAPQVEKDAGVEALFTRVFVLDEFTSDSARRVFYHYVRLKVFNEKGKEKVASIDLSSSENTVISNISGRTIKPDGTVVEMKGDAVHDREVVKNKGIKSRVKSFALPAVEPGVIVEYRYIEARYHQNLMYVRLQFQRDFPVQKATFFLKSLPSDDTGYRMYLWPFNCKPSSLKLETNGFNSTSLENVPAFRDEPMMPGEPNVRPWALALYRNDSRKDTEKYWSDIGKKFYTLLKQQLKINDEIREASAEAVQGAKNDEEKVGQLLAFLRRRMRGLYDTSVSDAERADVLKKNAKGKFRTSPEVFQSKVGTADELNTLFAAMAQAAGLEARPVFVADRDDLLFDPSLADIFFLRNIDMAVQIGDKWKIYDVSVKRLPPTMISWREEGMKALLSDPKKPVFIDSPLSPPESSVALRRGKLQLADDGTLEGSVEEVFTGHMAAERRLVFEGQTENKQQESLKDLLTKAFPGAAVTSIEVKNVTETEQALTLRYKVKIPGYAQRTGKRLFFQPLLLQKGDPPLFAASERRYPIYFPFAWQEIDELEIKMPAGMELDHADNPGDIAIGEPGHYKLLMGTKPGGIFYCRRDLQFGNNGRIAYPVGAYTQLKNLFDEIHRRDNHAISLKQSASGSN